VERAEFWKLIEEAKEASGGDPEEQVVMLRTRLTAYPLEEIISFDRILWQLMDDSYTWDLWAAAYILNGGCSNDCFDYFRGWLVAQGEQVFNDAMRDPETLASVAVFEEVELENMLSVAETAYEQVTGKDYNFSDTGTAKSWIFVEPKGEVWDEDTVDEKYPKLAAAFGYSD
jgi:hypothetical protein